MGEFLPRNKKERVKEVDELGEEIPGVENCKQRFVCIFEIQNSFSVIDDWDTLNVVCYEQIAIIFQYCH